MESITFDKKGKSIPLSEPLIQGNEWKYVKECLDTNWVSSSGTFVDRFEKVFAEYVGTKYAIACVNGTAALHVSLILSGVAPGEEVLMPALTFIAPANAIRYVGAFPVFIDVRADTYQIDQEKVIEFLSQECKEQNGKLVNTKTGRNVVAILPVHLLGQPVDMEPILDVAKKFGLRVIEDATESLGAYYKGKHVGTLGDLGCFSFNGNKIITTGGGGMIVTNKEEWAKKARYLITQAKDDPIEYVHNEIGYNYRLTNVQAAIGVAQMEKLNEYVTAKRRIAAKYKEGLALVPGIILPREVSWAESTFWLYTIGVDPGQYGMGSRDLMKALKVKGIDSRPFWHPLHTLLPFKNCMAYKVDVAEKLYKDCLSLPCSVGLFSEDQDFVIKIIREIQAKIL